MKTYFGTGITLVGLHYESDQSQFFFESETQGEDLKIGGGQRFFNVGFRFSNNCPTISMEGIEGPVCLRGNLFFPPTLNPS